MKYMEIKNEKKILSLFLTEIKIEFDMKYIEINIHCGT